MTDSRSSDLQRRKAAARQMFEENPDAMIKDVCAVVSLGPDTVGRIRREVHPQLTREAREQAASEKRAETIRALAAKGYGPLQISSQMGVNREWVVKLAQRHGIQFHVQRQHRRLNHRTAIEQTILSLDASASSMKTLGLLDGEIAGVQPEEAAEWARMINHSTRLYGELRGKLLKITTTGGKSNGNGNT